jgi:hypothetical protein
MAEDNNKQEEEEAEQVDETQGGESPESASARDSEISLDPEVGESGELDEDLAAAIGEAADGDGMSEVDIDQAILDADPDFSKDIQEISSQDFSGVVIDKASASDQVDESVKAPSIYKTLWNNLPKETKDRYYWALGIAAVALPLAFLVYKGKVLPSFDLPYLLSMKELTQDIYSYPIDGVKVPLFDEFRTQAHTVQLPQTVINLQSDGDDPSYGEFQFSFVLRDEDLSVALKAKESEILDLLQRVLEQVTWKELQTPIGKEKVKKVIRHRINEYLQGNVVLGVYYKHVILEK